jgi:hypothetical protein
MFVSAARVAGLRSQVARGLSGKRARFMASPQRRLHAADYVQVLGGEPTATPPLAWRFHGAGLQVKRLKMTLVG